MCLGGLRASVCVCVCVGDVSGWSKSKSSVPDPLGKARSASLRREASPYQSPRRSSPPSGRPSPPAGGAHEQHSAMIQLQIPGLPPELQGVSVKELVKAIGIIIVLLSALDARSEADIVKEYSSEYSDSAFKIEDTIVSRR